MGRTFAFLEANGQRFWTLFDTGARNTYVTEKVAQNFLTLALTRPEKTRLGGRTREVTSQCVMVANLEGHEVRALARVLPKIGDDERGRPIEVIFGALAMREWGLRPIPEEERVDLTYYSDTFVEFAV